MLHNTRKKAYTVYPFDKVCIMDVALKPILEDLDDSCNYCFVGSRYFGDKNMAPVLFGQFGLNIPSAIQQDIALQVSWALGNLPKHRMPHYDENLALMVGTGIGMLKPARKEDRREYQLMMKQICEKPRLGNAFIRGVERELDIIPENDGSDFWNAYYQRFSAAALPELQRIIVGHWERRPALAVRASKVEQDMRALPVRLGPLL